jgi:outer membrane protein OmpA-like peptidoglycan-associated protein
LFEKQVRYKITPTLFLADAQLRPQSGDTNWQKVSMSFIASGTELYLTLGNFSKRDVTGPTDIPSENNFFVFIDDISLVPEDAHERICNNWQATKEEIYSFHERHQFLDLYIKRHAGSPRESPEVGKTTTQKIDSVILPDIFFEVNRSALSAKSFQVLDNLSGILKDSQIDSLVIEGHTDNTGTDEHNQKLSIERGVEVAQYMSKILLLKKGTVVTRGWGGQKPVADNQTAAGRQRNRRVEIFIYIRQ